MTPVDPARRRRSAELHLWRWKLISIVLAGCLFYSWWHGEATSRPTAAQTQKRFKGPLRVSAAALGISTDELVRALFTTKDAGELAQLAERLGVVGDDAAIDAVLPLVHDPKCRVRGELVRAFGVIGSEHAVDVLIELARDSREDVRVAAVTALGETANNRGEPILIEIATRSGDEAQHHAIHALGELGSERAIEVLAQLAAHPDQIAGYAMRALARIESPAARTALVRLVDAPSLTVAANAIGELTERDLDPVMVAKLTSIVQHGDRDLVTPALGALAKAGDAGLPVLRAAALEGAAETRVAAMNILGDVDSPEVVETLRTIVETEQGRLADAAANVLSTIDSDEAREALISAALADEASGTRVVEYLLRQQGVDVDQALLVIAKSDSRERWDAVEHLVRGGNSEALQVAIAQAQRGEPERRLAAMEALADAGTQPALDALVELVHGSGDLKVRALAVLGGEPAPVRGCRLDAPAHRAAPRSESERRLCRRRRHLRSRRCDGIAALVPRRRQRAVRPAAPGRAGAELPRVQRSAHRRAARGRRRVTQGSAS